MIGKLGGESVLSQSKFLELDRLIRAFSNEEGEFSGPPVSLNFESKKRNPKPHCFELVPSFGGTFQL